MPKFDVTKLNVAIDRLLETTANRRHRFLLMACSRLRYLRVAGRYEETFAHDMMVMDPHFHFSQGGDDIELSGQDKIKSLCSVWARTNQNIFFIESEEVAVADHFVCSVVTFYQQVSGKLLKQRKVLSTLPGWAELAPHSSAISRFIIEKALSAEGFKADDNDTYLYKMVPMQMVWRYDEQGKLLGQSQWEPEPTKAEIIKIAPADVVTTEESAKLLAPFIKPLPSYDEFVSGKELGATA